MKRLIQIALVLTVTMVLATVSANAQKPIKFGFKGGINSAKFVGDDTGGLDGRTGIIGGLFANLKLAKGFSLQPELLYAQKGAKGPMTVESIPVDATIQMDYIEIPVLLKYNLGGRGSLSPFLIGGVAFSTIKSSKTKASVVGLPLLTGESDNFNERSSDIGIVVGGGIDLSMGLTRISAELRFTAGTKPIWNDIQGVTVPNDQWSYADADGKALDMKNSAVSVMVGLMF